MAQLLDLFGFLSVLLRGLTLAFQSLVIGGIVFSLAVDRGAAGAAAAQACRRLLVAASAGLVLAAGANLTADTAILTATTGLSLSAVAGAGFFLAGGLAVLLALLVLVVATLAGTGSRLALRAGLLAALGLLAASTATSHAAARLDGRALPLLLTGLHQAATACWIGGLPYLLLALPRARDGESARTLASRFSRLAQVSVAVLVGAGLGLALVYVGTPAAVLGTAYGAMVAAKAVLLALLLGLGALNLEVVRSVQAGTGLPGAASSAEADGAAAAALAGEAAEPDSRAREAPASGLLAHLRRFAEAEVGIGFTVILTAASLTSQPPAADLTSGPVPLAEIAARVAPRWPRLRPPAPHEMYPPSLIAAAAAPRGPLDSYVPGQLAEPLTPGEIALSEFNHNISGLIVLAAGLLAVAARAGWRWARNWPLAFLLLAVFLFFLADADYWPIGPLNFWHGFTVSEVLQHRLVVLLIVAFAFFERKVQTGQAASPRTALVFPFVCALGGALLLTHSHSLNNPKDELLAELSHIPIAILGVAAGWSRWLELRLDGGPRRALAWVWPVCFVLIGAILLDYRES